MYKGLILLIEDDPDLNEALSEAIELNGYQVDSCISVQSAISYVQKKRYDLILSDINLGDHTGIDLLAHMKHEKINTPVLLMTAFGKVEQAVEALQLGAKDYLMKPINLDDVFAKVDAYKQLDTAKDYGDGSIIMNDPKSRRLFDTALKIAKQDVTVLISGESGTGKEVLARFIHENSAREHKPFVAINCAAIPENMLEATLFGFEKGAFTGAHKTTAGKFELANGGSLLLDEITEMPLALQAKLLRVLQERQVERVGSKDSIELDLRIIATTNRDVLDEVKRGQFREDLYYRLNVIPLKAISLKERTNDIIPIAERIIVNFDDSGQVSLSEAAKNKLIRYGWPGNVRELQNVVQRAVVLAPSMLLEANDFQLEEMELSQSETQLSDELKSKEFQLIADALSELGGSRKDTAEKLGISARTLRYKLAKMKTLGWNI